jgi:hypothetical protein
VDIEPSDEDLRAFVGSILSNLDKVLSKPDVIDEAIRDRREMWVKLYRASSGLHISDSED